MTRLAAVLLTASALTLPAFAEDPPASPPATTPATPAPAAPAAADAVPSAPVATVPAAPDAAAAPAAPVTPAVAAAPAANMGRVYVSYPVQDKATYDANLAIDDLWIANAVKSGSCVYFDLPVGDHKLHTTATTIWHVTVASGGSSYADLRYRGGTINNVVPTDGSAPADLAGCTQGTSPL